MKINLRQSTLIFLYFLLATHSYSQVAKTGFRLLDYFNQMPDSVNDFSSYQPSPGITLKGQQDSLFSFTNGTVTEVGYFENGFYNVKILARHHYSIQFLQLKNTLLKIGDNIGTGWYIGSLNKHEGYSYPQILIWKGNALLSRKKSYRDLEDLYENQAAN
jgi:hypothetical protein